MSRRRREPRKTLICGITVRYEDEEGLPKTQAGLLEDRSLSGVGISLTYPIAIGSKVKIQGRVHALDGIVRHCRPKGANYFVGIRLDQEDVTWNKFGAGL